MEGESTPFLSHSLAIIYIFRWELANEIAIPVSKGFLFLIIALICAQARCTHHDDNSYGDMHTPTGKGKQEECFQTKNEESA
jgi:hypothetical protein